MAIRKRKINSGISWAYYFDAPGSTRTDRQTVTGSGYRTKKEAIDAEAARRLEIAEEIKQAAAGVTPVTFKTLGELLDQFLGGYCEPELGKKTTARYREMKEYLAPALLSTNVDELGAVHYTREWDRLRQSGGRHRKSKEARPLSAKSVRNIASFVSSAYKKALERGLVECNPVVASGKPKIKRTYKAVAFAPDQQRVFIDSAVHWIIPDILELAAATGARRGEVLALRWSDVQGGYVWIRRSLGQVGEQVYFKPTKTDDERCIALPPSALTILENVRTRQEPLRAEYGSDYRADLDLIFCEPNGAPLKPDSISGSVSQLRRRLKLPKGASLHALRHSHGSQLISEGVDIPTVSARLGHSSPYTTMKIYAHALKGKDAAAAAVWEKLQTAPRQHVVKPGASSAEDPGSVETKNERLRTN